MLVYFPFELSGDAMHHVAYLLPCCVSFTHWNAI